MAQWTTQDGYFGTLLAAVLGQATRQADGKQPTGDGGSTGAGKLVNADSALKLPAVWACCRLYAELVGSMPINVFDIRGERKKLITDHWINDLFLNGPNRHQTRNEFFETFVLNLFLHGNAYAAHDAAGSKSGRISSLVPMMSPQMAVTVNGGRDRRYEYTTSGDLLSFDQKSIWHAVLMPSNGLVGLSPIQYAARSLGIAISAEDRVATLAANGFKPTGILMLDKVLKPEQRENIRKEFSDLQTGAGDPFRVLEAGMKFQQVSMAPKDVQLLETRRFSTEDIARFYGVPSVLINDTAASTVWGSGISEIKEGFYTLALRPLLEKLESSILKWLIPATERNKIKIEFDFQSFLRGNEASRVETNTKAISGNLITINEARKRYDDLPPIEGGDRIYDQGQNVPIGTTSTASGGNDKTNPETD